MTRRLHPLAGSQNAELDEMRAWIGWRVDDVNGSGIGRVEAIIPDESERAAQWLVINEFRFGGGRRFLVPAREAIGSSGHVWLPFAADRVRGSANLGGVRHTPQAERRLRAYWGLPAAA